MTVNQNGGGGFIRILGIIYLIRLLKERRQRRHEAAATDSAVSQQDTAPDA
jgi:hypothetical protein